MGWDQSYKIPNEVELMEKILGIRAEDLLRDEMKKQGITIKKREPISIEGLWQNMSSDCVHLLDGRSLIPKISEIWRSDDCGIDVYKWCWSDEKPIVVEHFHDDSIAEET